MVKKERGPYGKNMIKVAIRFWTNNLPKGADKKTAWKGGALYLYKNDHKDIKPAMIMFDDINDDFQKKLFKLLNDQGIKLVEVPKEKFRVVNK
ncbi:MAG: hypothetical protein KJ879_00725 [Nanoarchaeota archaeon]|nr:hypothetical protein [Nanoarchaeota archaeon]